MQFYTEFIILYFSLKVNRLMLWRVFVSVDKPKGFHPVDKTKGHSQGESYGWESRLWRVYPRLPLVSKLPDGFAGYANPAQSACGAMRRVRFLVRGTKKAPPEGTRTGRRLALRGLHRRLARLLFEPKPTKPMAWRAVFDERTGQQNKRTLTGSVLLFW